MARGGVRHPSRTKEGKRMIRVRERSRLCCWNDCVAGMIPLSVLWWSLPFNYRYVVTLY